MKYNQNNQYSCTTLNTVCPKCPHVNAVLQKAGVDTSKFLALHIDRDDLPKNAEVVIQIRDKDTGKLIPVNLNDDNNGLLGKNSRFYGQVMADGHIFNPLIHRRFIAKQFRELVRRYGPLGLVGGVKKDYNWKYALDLIRKEAHKLAMLEQHDKDAFQERSLFFSLGAFAVILADYVAEVKAVIDRSVNGSWSCNNQQVFISGLGYVRLDHIRPTKHRFDCLRDNANKCRSYTELDKLLEGFQFMELSQHTQLAESFVIPFLEAGAYYTAKHAIMFEDKRVCNHTQQESLEMLLQVAQFGVSKTRCLDFYRQWMA